MTGSWPPLWCLGSRILVTVAESLCHSQAVVPLRMRSVSPICTGTARRTRRGPSYQTLTVCDPASNEVIEVGFWAPGSCGMPSEAVSTTVPVSGGTLPGPATAARSCAGVRGGSAGAACATVIADAMPTAATAATTTAGSAHRLRRDNFGTADMKTHSSLACWPPGQSIRPGRTVSFCTRPLWYPCEGQTAAGRPERAGARGGGRTAAGRGRAPGAAGGGLRRGPGPRRRGGAAPGAGRRLRRVGTGPDAAEDLRVQGLPTAAGREELGSDPHPVRQGRGVRPGGRAGPGRGRLPHQAVLLRGARRPAARPGPARHTATARPVAGRGPHPRPRYPAGAPRCGAHRSDPARVRSAGVPDAPGRPGGVQVLTAGARLGRLRLGGPERGGGLRGLPAP